MINPPPIPLHTLESIATSYKFPNTQISFFVGTLVSSRYSAPLRYYHMIVLSISDVSNMSSKPIHSVNSKPSIPASLGTLSPTLPIQFVPPFCQQLAL